MSLTESTDRPQINPVARTLLDRLFSEAYSPELLIRLLNVLVFPGFYERSCHVFWRMAGRDYTLGEHTGRALHVFDRFHGERELPGGANHNLFRLGIGLHDVGKPKGGVSRQHEFTVPMAEEALGGLNFDQKSIDLIMALICSDPIGGFLQNSGRTSGASEWWQVDEIKRLAQMAQMPVTDFFELLLIFFAVDTGSYDHLKDMFIVDEQSNTYVFAPHVEAQIQRLRTALTS